MDKEKGTGQKRTVWVIVIVVAVLGLLACCCIGIVVASSISRSNGSSTWEWAPGAPVLRGFWELPSESEGVEVSGSGQMVERDYAVGDVSGVRLTIPAELTIRLGDQPSLHVRAEDNIIELINVQEQGGELDISMQPGLRVVQRGSIQLVLTVPSLRSIANMGSGNVIGPELTGDRVSVNVSGSGDVRLEGIQAEMAEITAMGSGGVSVESVSVQQLKVNISGSGTVVASQGTATAQDLTVMGSGDYAALGVASERVDANLTGSGNAEVQVSTAIAARIMGSGNLEYVGSPTVSANCLGSGQVRQIRP